MTIKTNLYGRKIFYNDLVAVCKLEVILKIEKPANIRMCLLDLSKVLMNESL